MPLPDQPVTLVPEQVAELNRKLSVMRHDVNNNLSAKEKAYVGLVKELPCSVCDQEGPSDAHHVKQHRQYTVIALCKSCHQGSKMGWHGERRAWAIAKMEEIDALNQAVPFAERRPETRPQPGSDRRTE